MRTIAVIFFVIAVCMGLLGTVMAEDGGGCLYCHQGIEDINEPMEPYLIGIAQQQYGEVEGFTCSVCHEGEALFADQRKCAQRAHPQSGKHVDTP